MYLKASPCHRTHFWDPVSNFWGLGPFPGSRTPPNGFVSSSCRDFARRELLACHWCRNRTIFVISVFSGCLWGPECQGSLYTESLAPGSGSLGSSECLKIDLKIAFEFVPTRSTAEGVGGLPKSVNSTGESSRFVISSSRFGYTICCACPEGFLKRVPI